MRRLKPADIHPPFAGPVPGIEAPANRHGLGSAAAVRLDARVSAREHLSGHIQVRGARFPASTPMIAFGFAWPAFVMDVEALAAGVAT